jgi:hypothetical protein
MVRLGDESQVEHISVRLEILLMLRKDRYTVCTEPTRGSKIIWGTLTELQGNVGFLESYFGPFGGNVGVSAR